jgi:pteridine reductase
MRLEGEIVWVTGSARRVGREIALGCAREGADIVVHCRGSLSEAEATAGEIRALGRRAVVVQGDHGSVADVTRMVGEIREQFPIKAFEEIGEEEFFSIMRANAYGPFLCTQLALPLLRAASPGRVVNITDWAVQRPYRRYAHYMASKGALHTLTKALARELAPAVLVNEVAPGPVLEPEDLSPELKQKIVEKIPLQKWGTPENVVKAVVFLLESDNTCGETIVVDGGRSIG